MIVEAFVRDRPSGALINATRGASGQAPDSQIFNVGISGNGLAVSFNTQASTLVPGTGSGHDVFVKRLDTGLLEVASTSTGGDFSNGLFAILPSISYDGRRIAFVSNATNLSPADTDTGQDLYLKDLDTAAVQVAQLTDRQAVDSTLNADGTQAAFGTLLLPNNSPGPLMHVDFSTPEMKTISPSPCPAGGRAKLDGSGDRVGMVCSNGGALFKDHVANIVLTNQVANPLSVAVSSDGGAFAWEDIGQITTTLRMLRLTNTDDTPPVINHELSPSSPDGNNGWYRSNVGLTWQVTDPDSAVTVTGCADQTINADQPATAYDCSASSDGGITGPVMVSIKRDATRPVVRATVEPANPDGNAGWYVTRPTVTFECDDALSGVDTCPGSVSLEEGTTTINKQATDRAGNIREIALDAVSVDLTDPIVTCDPAPTFALNSAGATVTASVSDAGSGPASATVSASVDTAVAGAGSIELEGRDAAGRRATVTCDYTVTALGQTITFAPPTDKTFGDADFTVQATASSGLPVQFAAAGACTVQSANVHLTGAGQCSITASQPGSGNFTAAPDVSRSFAVTKSNQTITFAGLPGKTFLDADFTVSATASSGLPVQFSAVGVCTVNGTTVHLTAAGQCAITASQPGSDDFNAAPGVTRSFTVAVPLLDNFNRANGAVGANWIGATGTAFYRIGGNALDVQTGGPLVFNTAFGTTQEASVKLSTIDTKSATQGVLLKTQIGSIPTAGAISVVYDAKAKAVKVATLRVGDLAWTPYASKAVTFANGDILTGRATANGDVQIYRNGALVHTVALTTADRTFFNTKGGRIGIWTAGAANALMDDFRGGTIG